MSTLKSIHTQYIVLMNLALYSNLFLDNYSTADIYLMKNIIQYIWSIRWIILKCSNGKHRPRWKLKSKLHKFNKMARNAYLRLLKGKPLEFERFFINGKVRERFEVYHQRHHWMRWNRLHLSLNVSRTMRAGRYMMRRYLLNELIAYVYFIYLINNLVLGWQMRWVCNAIQPAALLNAFVQISKPTMQPSYSRRAFHQIRMITNTNLFFGKI